MITRVSVDLERFRDRWHAQRRCYPVSPQRDPARSARVRASRSNRAAPGRAPRPGDRARIIRPRTIGCCPESAARPGTGARRPASGGRSGCAALVATRAPGHEPHDDDDGYRDQPDDEKHLERGNDPAHSREGKRYGEDRADDCPDDPAHVPSMRRGLWQATVVPAAPTWGRGLAGRLACLAGTARIRRYTGDRRSPKPFGRITQDTRVILASFFDPICGDDHPCISRSEPPGPWTGPHGV